MQKLCQVCNDQQQKYRCPKCLMKYCTPQCFRAHRCKPPKQVPKCENEEEQGIFKSDYVDDDVKLAPQKLEMLKNSKKIRSYLQSSKLRKKLIEIDDSKQRMSDLNQEIKHNKEFETFAYELLQEMGIDYS